MSTMPSSLMSVSTGNGEIDKKLGGGIPAGSLTLIEGHSDAGKSVLCQHLAHGSLQSGMSAAYYTAENTVKSLVNQMASLGLEVSDYFLVDQLRIYPPQISSKQINADRSFGLIAQHIETLPESFKIIIVDSVTNIVTHSHETSILDFFSTCKGLCDSGRTVFIVVHSYGFDEKMLIRVRSLCDAHLTLRMEQMGDRLIKMLEVSKVRNADRTTGNIVSFDVEPGLGMRIIPSTKAKA